MDLNSLGTIKIIEYFNSIQGEGEFAGLPMTFIRLKECNLRCPFCDTRPWDASFAIMTPLTLVHTLQDLMPGGILPHVCITGGEPLLDPGLPLLIDLLADLVDTIHIETNASPQVWTSKLDEKVRGWRPNVQFTVSPKTPKWGMADFYRGPYEFISDIKILVGEDGPLNIGRLDDFIDVNCSVYLQPVDPGGTEPYIDRVKDAVFKICSILKEYPEYQLSLQLHKLLNLR